MKERILLLSLILLLASTCYGEFQVNVRTSNKQTDPDIAADANGNFVVVWRSYFSDKSGEIYGRRFDSDGNYDDDATKARIEEVMMGVEHKMAIGVIS